MLESVSDSGRQLVESDIKNFEEKNKLEFPFDYKKFLLKYNGGSPKQDTYALTSHREGEMDIAFFYGLDLDNEHLGLQWRYDFHNENLLDPAFENLFPIGYDGCGDPICLDLSDQRHGAVIFIDMVPIWKDHTAKDLYVIASSFSEFLEMLYEVEDDDL